MKDIKNLNLTKQETDAYFNIVQNGNMDDMFELGYVIGRHRVAEENLELISSLEAK